MNTLCRRERREYREKTDLQDYHSTTTLDISRKWRDDLYRNVISKFFVLFGQENCQQQQQSI